MVGVRGEEGRGGRTDADDIELETALEQLALDLLRDAVETDVALRIHALRRLLLLMHGGHWSRGLGWRCLGRKGWRR